MTTKSLTTKLLKEKAVEFHPKHIEKSQNILLHWCLWQIPLQVLHQPVGAYPSSPEPTQNNPIKSKKVASTMN
jgi:hypothetical protein